MHRWLPVSRINRSRFDWPTNRRTRATRFIYRDVCAFRPPRGHDCAPRRSVITLLTRRRRFVFIVYWFVAALYLNYLVNICRNKQGGSMPTKLFTRCFFRRVQTRERARTHTQGDDNLIAGSIWYQSNVEAVWYFVDSYAMIKDI